MKTREEVLEIIKESAVRHGFDFVCEPNGWTTIRDGEHWDKAWVNFTVTDECGDFDMEAFSCDYTVTVSASPCRMGGNNTVTDLREAADHLSRAADLVEELSHSDLMYKRYYNKNK